MGQGGAGQRHAEPCQAVLGRAGPFQVVPRSPGPPPAVPRPRRAPPLRRSGSSGTEATGERGIGAGEKEKKTINIDKQRDSLQPSH